MPTIKKLKNGATLILAPKKETQIIDVVISFLVGSRYEDAARAGISHFYEHLMFDGTKNRPTANTLSKEVDAMGAVFNAHTSDEYTTYYISASENYLPKVIEILGDMISNSLLSEKDIKKEKNVITEEIKMFEDMPGEYVSDVYDQAIFNGDPLARSIIGQRETIGAIDRQDVLDFKKKFYVGNNCFIGIGGNFSKYAESEIVALIETHLDIASGEKTEFFSASVSSKAENYLKKDTAQTNLVAGFLGPAYSSTEYPSFRTLATILGGNMSSRMFNKIREEMELAYDIRTEANSLVTIGTIATSAGVPNEKFALAIDAISAEYQRVKEDLTAEEVEKAKAYQIGQARLMTENSYNMTYLILRYYFMTGKLISIDEFVAKIESVTVEDVRNVAKKYLIKEKMTVAAIGPGVVARPSLRAIE